MKKLLVGLLLVSNSIFCDQDGVTILVASPSQVAGIILSHACKQAAEVEAEEIAQITNISELDQKIQDYLARRKDMLEHCGDQVDGQACDSIISYFERMISTSLARKFEIGAAIEAKVNAANVAEKIEAAGSGFPTDSEIEADIMRTAKKDAKNGIRYPSQSTQQ